MSEKTEKLIRPGEIEFADTETIRQMQEHKLAEMLSL